MRSTRFRTWLLALLALLGGYLMARVQGVVQRPPLVLGQDAISSAQSSEAKVTLENVGGPVIHIQNPSKKLGTLLIFYPGGLVRPQAYEWIGRDLAYEWAETVIPAFPLDLAVIQSGRADALIKQYAQGRRVVLAGHSLGGAMAAQYASKHPNQIGGLILMGAYPAKNISLKDAKFPVLSLWAEHDGLAKPEDVKDGLNRLPAGTQLVEIPGSVHSFFGRYGPQKGDGIPTVSRAQAETEILKQIKIFMDGLPNQ